MGKSEYTKRQLKAWWVLVHSALDLGMCDQNGEPDIELIQKCQEALNEWRLVKVDAASQDLGVLLQKTRGDARQALPRGVLKGLVRERARLEAQARGEAEKVPPTLADELLEAAEGSGVPDVPESERLVVEYACTCCGKPLKPHKVYGVDAPYCIVCHSRLTAEYGPQSSAWPAPGVYSAEQFAQKIATEGPPPPGQVNEVSYTMSAAQVPAAADHKLDATRMAASGLAGGVGYTDTCPICGVRGVRHMHSLQEIIQHSMSTAWDAEYAKKQEAEAQNRMNLEYAAYRVAVEGARQGLGIRDGYQPTDKEVSDYASRMNIHSLVEPYLERKRKAQQEQANGEKQAD